jgi:hypothetical protein
MYFKIEQFKNKTTKIIPKRWCTPKSTMHQITVPKIFLFAVEPFGF